MPQTSVGAFTGEGVYGSAGEYRYDHPDGTAVHVGHDPQEDGKWMVGVDQYEIGGDVKVLRAGMDRNEAFGFAYGWMHSYSDSRAGFGFGGGSGVSL